MPNNSRYLLDDPRISIVQPAGSKKFNNSTHNKDYLISVCLQRFSSIFKTHQNNIAPVFCRKTIKLGLKSMAYRVVSETTQSAMLISSFTVYRQERDVFRSVKTINLILHVKLPMDQFGPVFR